MHALKLWPVALAMTAMTLEPAAAQEEFQWRGRVSGGREVEIKGVNGDIRAEIAGGAEVQVIARKRGRRSDPDDVQIEVIEHGGGVTVCAVYPSRRRGRSNECRPGSGGRNDIRNNDVQVNFTVRVPAGVALIARTVNGEIYVHSLESDVEAHTVNGDVDISTTGFASARTVNGSIDAVVGRMDGRAPVEFETVNGSISLDLPEGLNADLRAATVNGGIFSDFPLVISGRLSRRRLNGQIGDGGRLLELNTVNGSIRLQRSP